MKWSLTGKEKLKKSRDIIFILFYNFFQERHANTEEINQETMRHYEKTISDLKEERQTLQETANTVNFDLSNVRREKSDLIDMNENLSNQVSEQLNSIKKLQDHEQDLIQKVENSKRDLELAHNGKS